MFAVLFAHFALSLISFVSLIATQPVADNLFTDWGSSDLTDATTSDSDGQFLSSDANSGQLLAFNDDPSSNTFMSDFSTADSFGQTSTTDTPLGMSSTSDSPWDLSNTDTALDMSNIDSSLDMSNMFLDSTPLDSLGNTAYDPSGSDEQTFSDFSNDLSGNDLSGNDASSLDLLADGSTGDCSRFRPSSPSRKRRKRETACKNTEYTDAGANFLSRSAAQQAETYKKLVCPADHFGAAVSIPVCSSADPTKTVRMGPHTPPFPDSDTLADSNLRASSAIPPLSHVY